MQFSDEEVARHDAHPQDLCGSGCPLRCHHRAVGLRHINMRLKAPRVVLKERKHRSRALDFTPLQPSLSDRRRGVGVSCAIPAPLMTHRAGEPVVMLDHDVGWDAEADVVVVGSSVAGLSVAVNAARLGCETVVLEKAALIGGTARKVGAWFWLPNNRFMSEFGIDDTTDEALGYLARAAEPARFDPDHPTLGLEAWQFELFVAFCDNAARAMEAVEAADAMSFVAKPDVPNYYSHHPADHVPYGRVVMAALRSGEPADGLEFVRRMEEFLRHHDARILTGHAVEGIIRSSEGTVLGTRARTAEGTVRIRARRGVVFCSGGFAHSEELRSTYLDGLLLPGCTASTNDGIFVEVTRALGVPLFNMHAALMSPVQLEWALERDPDWLMDFVTPGDSIITVNAMGERVLNEKTSYHDRSLAHLAFDVQTMSYSNFALFSIWDERTAGLWAGREYGCVPSADGDWRRVVEGRLAPGTCGVSRFEVAEPRFGGSRNPTGRELRRNARTHDCAIQQLCPLGKGRGLRPRGGTNRSVLSW